MNFNDKAHVTKFRKTGFMDDLYTKHLKNFCSFADEGNVFLQRRNGTGTVASFVKAFVDLYLA